MFKYFNNIITNSDKISKQSNIYESLKNSDPISIFLTVCLLRFSPENTKICIDLIDEIVYSKLDFPFVFGPFQRTLRSWIIFGNSRHEIINSFVLLLPFIRFIKFFSKDEKILNILNEIINIFLKSLKQLKYTYFDDYDTLQKIRSFIFYTKKIISNDFNIDNLHYFFISNFIISNTEKIEHFEKNHDKKFIGEYLSNEYIKSEEKMFNKINSVWTINEICDIINNIIHLNTEFLRGENHTIINKHIEYIQSILIDKQLKFGNKI